MPISYTLIQQKKETKKLAIFFPGKDYTAHSPLFHYTANFLGESSHDILSIPYPYYSGEYDWYSEEEKIDILKKDVNTLLDQLLETHYYDSFFIVSKSIGSIALSSAVQRKEFEDAKIIWLTPLLDREDVYSSLLECTQKSLGFVGDKDAHYSKERFTNLAEKETLSLHLIEGANHLLEHEGDLSTSLNTLEKIIVSIKAFQETL